MLESLSNFLAGPHAKIIFTALKVAILALFAFVLAAHLAVPALKKGTSGYRLLRILFFLAFAAVLVHQAYWQLYGFRNPDFIFFVRHHNRRPQAVDILTRRGPILDRNGLVLAAPPANDVWGRRYPLGEAGVHPIGYYHRKYGITAVERIKDPLLSGCAIEKEGKSHPLKILAPRSREGQTVSLTLESGLQRFAYQALEGKKGAVIVMDPRNGELFALVSAPGFNPLSPETALFDSQNKPAFNRAVQGQYPPGSTFKLLIAGMAIDMGKMPVLNCPAEGYRSAPHTPPIRDSEYYSAKRRGGSWNGWGNMGLRMAIVHSSNVYFSQLGVLCGVEAFNAMIERAKINDQLLYMTGEKGNLLSARGSVPIVTRKATLAQPAIGQGKVLVTPLHVACYTAAIAADGKMPLPRLGLSGEREPPIRLFSPRSASFIRSAMRETVRCGTGRGADIPGLEVCGKTGTAQVPTGKDHAWFTCFAPEDDPRLVVTVLVEHGGFGARAAVPVARRILLEAQKLGVFKGKTGGRRG